jgi:SNF2 family DNA or RNA helicase
VFEKELQAALEEQTGMNYDDIIGLLGEVDPNLDEVIGEMGAEDIIEAAGDKPRLVAYWFKHDLVRITERLQKLHVPYSKLDSAESIKRWNDGELPVALVHPASAGHGLNLQSGGSCIVWFGLTWSLELYQQTNARLWRQGQSAKTVVVQHIVTKGTIDERILKVLSKKDSTQAALIEAVKADLQI